LKQIRKRFTYANVMSSIAVFLVVGGATAFAAGHLGKNTVGTKQLKKNAVTTKKIKKNAVTTAKIRKEAVTGAKIKLSSLGTVPSATNAVNATNATHATEATNATNASTVNGQSQTKVFKTLLPGESGTVATIAGFTISASCESTNIDVTVTSPSSPASVLSSETNGSSEGPLFEYDAEESGTSSEIRLDGESGNDNDYGEATFSGALSNGVVVSGDVGYDYETFGGEAPERCIVYGEVASG
jgi:hypothetical protein